MNQSEKISQNEGDQSPKKPPTRDENFIKSLIEICHGDGPKSDKGMAAQLRRSDNPATEYQCWEFLARFSIDLENPYQRLPYTTLCATIAKARPASNGSLWLGRAIARCYDDGMESSPAIARLRRLLASQDLEEVCRVLRSCFALINSRVQEPLDYLNLLQQLKSFPHDSQRVKAQWAQSFYHCAAKEMKKGGDE